MSPARAVAAKNISTVAGDDEIMMNEEQLRQALQKVSADLDKLANSDKPLTKEEREYQNRLLRRKYVLGKIKEAKDKKRKDDEVFNSTVYEMLVSWGERHLILMGIMTHLMRIKWGSGLASVSLREAGVKEKK
jgi:hypothetical protein